MTEIIDRRFGNTKTEAANRAEVTALLIRSNFRVYRPEADQEGEDLVIRAPNGELRAVQLKGRAVVDWRRYGDRSLWMLFPEHQYSGETRAWFLVPHDSLFAWVKKHNGTAPKWADHWSFPSISKALRLWLDEWLVRPDASSVSPDEISNDFGEIHSP